jgi:hypothetical protein
MSIENQLEKARKGLYSEPLFVGKDVSLVDHFSFGSAWCFSARHVKLFRSWVLRQKQIDDGAFSHVCNR